MRRAFCVCAPFLLSNRRKKECWMLKITITKMTWNKQDVSNEKLNPNYKYAMGNGEKMFENTNNSNKNRSKKETTNPRWNVGCAQTDTHWDRERARVSEFVRWQSKTAWLCVLCWAVLGSRHSSRKTIKPYKNMNHMDGLSAANPRSNALHNRTHDGNK